MRTLRKYLIWAAGAGAVGLIAWTALRDRPIEVDIGTVRRGTLQVTVDAEGRTRVRNRYVLTAPVGGRLERIELVEGAFVRAGQVVARIAPAPLDIQSTRQAAARLDATRSLARDADARVEQAAATLAQERRTATRVERLVSAGALAEREREDALLTVRLREEDLTGARARARAASADVTQARSALLAVGGASSGAVVLVRAPADGCVFRVPERSERVVAAGASIAEIGDPTAQELVVDVLSSDAARIRAGAPVIVDRWGEAEELAGRVRYVEPAAFTRVSALGVEEQRVNVVIDIPRWPSTLSDGYRVDTRIIVWEQPGTTIVPVSALFRHERAWAVFVVADGEATLRTLRVGEQGAAGAQVLDGLTVGDRVVLFPSDQITAGRRVTAAR